MGGTYVIRYDLDSASVLDVFYSESKDFSFSETQDQYEKLFEDPWLIKTPVVRNGKQATVGYCPEVWRNWE